MLRISDCVLLNLLVSRKEGKVSERCESWLNSYRGGLALGWVGLFFGFGRTSHPIQCGRMGWSCRGSEPFPLSLTNRALIVRDALTSSCGSHWPGLHLL